MRRAGRASLSAATAIVLVLLAAQAPANGASAEAKPAYTNTSWALGIVVPEGSGLQNGGAVRWQAVTNVTADVTLPNITLPDRNIYAVLSVMADNGAVMQVAAGALPNRSVWMTFAWFVPDASAAQVTYDWVLNASEPQVAPNSGIVLSIFWAPGGWNVKVSEAGSGRSVLRQFPSGASASLRSGDQEVFAVESYSRAQSTFRDMDNLTLDGLMLNGERVVRGFYTYSQWDPIHNPVFVVGSAGSSLPSFINIGEGAPGSFFWDYVATWPTSDGSPVGLAQLVIVAVLALAAAAVASAAWLVRNRRGPEGRP